MHNPQGGRSTVRGAHGHRQSIAQQPPFPRDGRAPEHPRAQRSVRGRRPAESISLEDGMNHLYAAVNDAIHYFARFDHEFRQDTHLIRNYCGKRLIEAIWASKVRPHTQSQSQHGQRARFEDEYIREGPVSDFESAMERLLFSLRAALTAAEEFRPSQRRPSRFSAEGVARIQKQVHRTFQNIRRSYTIVMERRSEMETVNTELEMLRVFLSRNGAEEGRRRDDPEQFREGGARPPRGDSELEGGSHTEESVEQLEEWTGGKADEPAAGAVAGDAGQVTW
ncbi:MAG: hypothetical protein LQ345_004422 [Seirophora villosa]|nr:MAG: hypothetical protein LQ345_004422 [Seirophora villosa]